MYYRIGERIEEFEPTTFENIPFQYIAVIGSEEWTDSNRKFDMGIEWDINIEEITSTRAEVNFDSLTGTFSIPSRKNISGANHKYLHAAYADCGMVRNELRLYAGAWFTGSVSDSYRGQRTDRYCKPDLFQAQEMALNA